MIEHALAKIEADVLRLAELAEHAWTDPYDLKIIARQIDAQIEMHKQGLVE